MTRRAAAPESRPGRDSDRNREPGLDRELAHLPQAARWREWLARIEAVLFASAEPVSRARLACVVGQEAILDDLLGDLRDDLAGRPCDLVAVADGWMLRTRPAYAPAIRAAARLPASRADLPQLRETDLALLAAIATRQPVTRAELADLFGRSIGPGPIARLTAHDLVAPGPRSPTPGAPRTLVTTDAFLVMFGLQSLEEMGEGGR